MCILWYIYGSHSLELGEDIELFYVVQDFCLVTVWTALSEGWKRWWNIRRCSIHSLPYGREDMSHEYPMLQRSQLLGFMKDRRVHWSYNSLTMVARGDGSMGVVSLRFEEEYKKQSRPTGVDRRPFVQEVGYALDWVKHDKRKSWTFQVNDIRAKDIVSPE